MKIRMGENMTITSERLGALERSAGEEAELVRRLLERAPRGLAQAYLPESVEFAQTVRGAVTPSGVTCRREGRNLRYAAMAALGLARTDEAIQRETLAGASAREVVRHVVRRAPHVSDPGAVALAAWAAAEVDALPPGELVTHLERLLVSGTPLHTVDVAWMLTAATVAAPLVDTARLLDLAASRLLAHQGAQGIYPHVVPNDQQSRWRAHVGSFADQVYPLQALARASVVTGDPDLLAAAEVTAAQICRLQGPAGQWWWHYDSRDGSVVEGYPVYSVHQHAMAPMVLRDLVEAGGTDHLSEVAAGVSWLRTHPEVREGLECASFGLVWRKVGRREPRKAARAVAALTTSVRPGLHLPGLDRALPPGRVDHECRPYELGWLLYAWLPELV